MDGGTSPGDHSLFRVRLWGTLRVEKWIDGRSEVVKTTDWGGSNYPRLLLKGLLCCPERSARREALLEMLWPEMGWEQATANLNTATTKLRMLLRAARGQESLLVTEDDATLYHLPAQEVLWVDSDAVQEKVEQAERIGRTTREALSLLEEAIALSNRGPFLEGEEGQWAAEKRATRELERYRGRLWLVDNYIQQALFGRAEAILHTLRENDPFDEDILRRLLGVLQCQGMMHQALRLYEKAHHLFAEEGLELTDATQAIARYLQTGDAYKVYPAMDQLSLSHVQPFFKEERFSGDRANFAGVLPIFSGKTNASFLFEYPGATLPSSPFFNDFSSPAETLKQLAWALANPSRVDDTLLSALEALVKDCWRFRPDIVGLISPHLLQLVFGHLRHIAAFLSTSLLTSIRMRLCALVSELAQIAGWTLYEMHAFSDAKAFYDMALLAAREAENAVLEAVVLTRMSRILKYCALGKAIPSTLEYAHRLLADQGHSPAYSWICAETALAYAREQRSYESQKMLEQVTQTFRAGSQEDDLYWIGFEENVKAGFFGSCYVALHQFDQAEQSYREALAHIHPTSRIHPKHRRSLLSVNLATLLLEQDAVGDACQLATEALLLVKQSQSPLVLEHIARFREKLHPWKAEAQVETFHQAFEEVHILPFPVNLGERRGKED